MRGDVDSHFGSSNRRHSHGGFLQQSQCPEDSWPHAMQRRHLPNKPHATPADGQCFQWGRGCLRNDRHALKRCRPPNHIRRLAQRLSRPGMQPRQDRFRAVGYGQSRQDRGVLWQHGQPPTCRPRYSFLLPAGRVSTQLLDPTTGKLPTAVIIRSARPPGVQESSSGSEARHRGKTV